MKGEPVPPPAPHISFTQRSIVALRARSDELRHMARAASTEDVETALLRLVARFDRLANKVQLARMPEHKPGQPASASGLYHEVNIFGTPTGRTERAYHGEPLPRGPRGWGWRPAEADDNTNAQ
jgi:hypothetical protein